MPDVFPPSAFGWRTRHGKVKDSFFNQDGNVPRRRCSLLHCCCDSEPHHTQAGQFSYSSPADSRPAIRSRTLPKPAQIGEAGSTVLSGTNALLQSTGAALPGEPDTVTSFDVDVTISVEKLTGPGPSV